MHPQRFPRFGPLASFASACLVGCALSALAADTSRVRIRADQGKHTISRMIYGQFSEHLGRCVYEGYWVGEDSLIPNVRGIRTDVVEALKRIQVPVIRWPGGCFADEYHWMDGIGAPAQRPTMVNTHWGGVTENNGFGTHEFMDLCAQIGCEPYVCGNMGSGSVQEMQQWVEYMTFDGISPMADLRRRNGQDKPWKLPWFGVGNENWGCGGNMTAEFYADQVRRYGTYVRNFGGNHIQKIACGPNGWDYRWTEVLMEKAASHINGLALHYYCGTGKQSRSATKYEEGDWFHLLQSALRIDELVTKHAAIMDRFDKEKRVGLMVDEWGTWHEVEPGSNPGFLYQQNTIRDALVAGLSLNIFNQHADRVRMANIAQTVNVLQAMILTAKDKMILTPTYHVYEMYTVHHDATLLPAECQSSDYAFGGQKLPAVSVSASRAKDGKVHVTLCNLDPTAPRTVTSDVEGMKVAKVSGRVLTAPSITAHNTFEAPDVVKPVPFTESEVNDKGFTTTLPPRSVVVLTLE